MSHRLFMTLMALAMTLVPTAAADAVQTVELDDGTELIDEDQTPRGLPSCPATTEEELAFDDPACLNSGTDDRGYPVHTVCLYDTWFPLWTGGEVFCMTTEHWAYLPAPGACVDVLEFHKPTACANGHECVFVVAGVRVICEAGSSY